MKFQHLLLSCKSIILQSMFTYMSLSVCIAMSTSKQIYP